MHKYLVDQLDKSLRRSGLTIHGDGLRVYDEQGNDIIEPLMKAYEYSLQKYTFPPGTKVEKISGYPWPGVVVSEFLTLAGEKRVVVECTVPEVSGALHIYSIKQLRRVDG